MDAEQEMNREAMDKAEAERQRLLAELAGEARQRDLQLPRRKLGLRW